MNSYRRNRIHLILAIALLALVACGGQEAATTPEEPESSPAEATATTAPEPQATATTAGEPASETETETTEETAGAAFPVNIEHKFGSTTIEEEPERVIALGYNEQDAILALGVKPVAVRYWFGDEPHAVFPWAQDELGDAEPEVLEMAFGELDFEKIAALQPDLISAVYAGITEEEYETLSQIAPTIAQTGEYVDFGMPWQEMTLTVGRALGRAERAEELVADVEAQFAEAREEHPEWEGKTVVVGAPRGDDQFGFVASQDARSRVFTSLGFEVPAEFDEIAGDQFFGTISMERADLLDQDLLVIHQVQFIEGGRQAVESNPFFQQLDVVQEGRVVFVEGELDDALQFGTVLSLPFLLDGLVPKLEAAIPGDAAAGAGEEAEETAAFPVTIEHKFGSIEIPQEPERVVTVGFSEQDPVLALGVTPVAVREWFGGQPHAVWPWSQDELGDAEPEVLTMPYGELNYEAIAALQPDLLVATHSGITEEEYETLSQIAPTLAQTADYPDFGMPWQEQTRLIGRALGREARAEELIAGVEAQIAAAREEHPAFEGATVAWASPADEGQYWAVGPNTPPMRFLADLGFQMPAELADVVGEQDSAQISSEQLTLLDADVLIFQVSTPEARQAIENDPLYQQLNAAQEGRTIFFVGLDNPVYGALSFSTVASLPYAIEELVPQLEAAVDGDPSTEGAP